MIFRNRQEAARKLAPLIAEQLEGRPLVLGIPRGGVVMAYELADALEGDLDVVLVHKLGAPGNPEVAIGSVDETGHVYLNDYGRSRGISTAYIEEEKNCQLALLRERRKQYTPVHPPIDPAGREVVVVDDGLATGATMIAALAALRNRAPKTLLAAAAVAPPETLREVSRQADETIILLAPPNFMAVGQYFNDFSQVSDREVMDCLGGASPENRPS